LVIDLPGFRPITGTGGIWLILWMKKTVIPMGGVNPWNAENGKNHRQ